MELDERIYKEKVISFKKGLPGLENLHEYVLLTPDDLYPIYILQSVKEPGILLPVINPFDIDENYKAPIGKRDFEELNIAEDDDVLILNVAVIPSDIHKMTVNLAAPIVINTKTLVGKQVIPDGTSYSIREPLYQAYIKLRNGGEDSCSCCPERKVNIS